MILFFETEGFLFVGFLGMVICSVRVVFSCGGSINFGMLSVLVCLHPAEMQVTHRGQYGSLIIPGPQSTLAAVQRSPAALQPI